MGFWSNFKNSNLIAAHRGYRAIRAENTLSAFKAAIGRADFIELDVGFTKDGIPIVIHDDTLQRTTNVKDIAYFKEPYSVVDYSYKELQKLDFSSWFIKSDPFGTIESGLANIDELKQLPKERVLSLYDALSFLKAHNMPVNVELKDMRGSKFNSVAPKSVASVVASVDMDNLILFSSFNHNYLKELATLLPNISRSALQEFFHPKDIVKYLKELSISGYHCDVDIADSATIELLKTEGFKVAVYTVNEREKINSLYKLGVDAIFTDFL